MSGWMEITTLTWFAQWHPRKASSWELLVGSSVFSIHETSQPSASFAHCWNSLWKVRIHFVYYKYSTVLIVFSRNLLHQGLHLVFNILRFKLVVKHLMAVFWGSVWCHFSVHMSLLHPWFVCASACTPTARQNRRKHRSRTDPRKEWEDLNGSNHSDRIIRF